MLMVCKNECLPVITIFHFSPQGFFKTSVQGSEIKLRFTLAICLTHLSMLQVCNNILILPMRKNPHGNISTYDYVINLMKRLKHTCELAMKNLGARKAKGLVRFTSKTWFFLNGRQSYTITPN